MPELLEFFTLRFYAAVMECDVNDVVMAGKMGCNDGGIAMVTTCVHSRVVCFYNDLVMFATDILS